MVKKTKETKTPKAKKANIVDPAEEFEKKVKELKKEKSVKELLEIVSIQPFNYELADFMAARKALDELKVKYPRGFRVSCEERIAKGE